ncbi:fimbrial biogenesis chaperone [Herbaspirillum autotrophicum]|uniref:fimbrial biogenesis chaperone n=1 Tax=Herbaspirillum autotrophicum TaxID=180195 RepID=UPI001E5559AA|nr:hypothetical protein [Herbaspirillum autotrophicum]
MAAVAAPSIHIGAMYDYLEDDRSTLLKRIRNSGDSTAFVRVSITEVSFGETGEPQEKIAAAISLGQKQAGATLVASPARLIIPAGGMQAARLMYLGQRDRERYFRVRFVPVAPEEKEGFSPENAAEYRQSVSAGVTMLMGYGAMLFVAPKRPSYHTEVVEQDQKIIVRNNGNATVVLADFHACEVDGNDCGTPSKYHVLPGRTREFVKEAGHEYRFKLHEGKRDKTFEFAG